MHPCGNGLKPWVRCARTDEPGTCRIRLGGAPCSRRLGSRVRARKPTWKPARDRLGHRHVPRSRNYRADLLRQVLDPPPKTHLGKRAPAYV